MPTSVPRVGVEPTTSRFSACCSATELPKQPHPPQLRLCNRVDKHTQAPTQPHTQGSHSLRFQVEGCQLGAAIPPLTLFRRCTLFKNGTPLCRGKMPSKKAHVPPPYQQSACATPPRNAQRPVPTIPKNLGSPSSPDLWYPHCAQGKASPKAVKEAASVQASLRVKTGCEQPHTRCPQYGHTGVAAWEGAADTLPQSSASQTAGGVT